MSEARSLPWFSSHLYSGCSSRGSCISFLISLPMASDPNGLCAMCVFFISLILDLFTERLYSFGACVIFVLMFGLCLASTKNDLERVLTRVF